MLRLIEITVFAAGALWLGYHAYVWYGSRNPEPAAQGHSEPAPAGRTNVRSKIGIAEALLQRVTATEGMNGNYGGGPEPKGGVGAVYYSPWQNLEAIDANAIADSHCNHLDIAAYAFTDWKLAEPVAAFARSGRPVRIYRDREQYEQEQKRSSRVSEILRAPNIAIRVKNSSVLMHLKAWSDGCILREGSANWSPSGEKEQDNTLTFLSDSASVNNFEAAFEAMWDRPDNIVVQ